MDELSLASKAPTPGSRELAVYIREVHPVFNTVPDYRAALRFFSLRYPKVQEILTDWSNN